MSGPRVLSIAGSDSGGGAGIQADLKTFAALKIYGMTAITAVTVQNSLGVSQISPLAPEIVAAQIDSVLTDIGADAVKTGMLFSVGIVRAVSEAVSRHQVKRLVIDPVMVAKGGRVLLEEDARWFLRNHLLPQAYLVTPNVPEAEILAQIRISDLKGMRDAALRICYFGARAVVIKGGHLSGDPIDLLFDGQHFFEFPGRRHDTRNTHGTGCTFSAAAAAALAKGLDLPDAVDLAKRFTDEAIRNSLSLGAGHGPVNQQAWDDLRHVDQTRPVR